MRDSEHHVPYSKQAKKLARRPFFIQDGPLLVTTLIKVIKFQPTKPKRVSVAHIQLEGDGVR